MNVRHMILVSRTHNHPLLYLEQYVQKRVKKSTQIKFHDFFHEMNISKLASLSNGKKNEHQSTARINKNADLIRISFEIPNRIFEKFTLIRIPNFNCHA